jgi:hypothetical protein
MSIRYRGTRAEIVAYFLGCASVARQRAGQVSPTSTLAKIETNVAATWEAAADTIKHWEDIAK